MRYLVVMTVMASLGFSQDIYQGENITLWHQYDNIGLFNNADSLWMGGVFLRDTTQPLTIRLHGNEAGIRGNLYLMVPGYADSAFYIFNNHVDPNSSQAIVDLSNFDIGHLDTIVFMYSLFSQDKDPLLWRTWSTDLRYSGPNRRVGDSEAQGAPATGWVNTDRFSSNAIYGGRLPNNTFANYRRWSVAGWLQHEDELGERIRTNTVAFGFEDLSPGDADFDDIVFHLTGVFLNHQPAIDTLFMSAQPARATIPAGDSVVYLATVIVDSCDQFGTHHTVRRPAYDALVVWQVSGPSATTANLRYGSGPSATNTFYGLIAGATYTVTATFTDPNTGKTTSTSMTVTVTFGPPDKISIESSPDGNGQEVTTRTLSTSQEIREDFYAVVRDRFNNYMFPAFPVVWSSTPGGIVNATVGAAPTQGQGRITRLGSGETTVRVSYSSAGRTLTDQMSVSVSNITYSQIRIGVREQNQFFQIDTLRMQTIHDTTLYLQGLQSIPGGQWVDIEGTWEASSSLASSITTPGVSLSWEIAPLTAATGWIKVALPNTTPDTITVEFVSPVPQLVLLDDTIGTRRPVFYWHPSGAGASQGYIFELASDSGFNDLIVHTVATVTMYVATTDLPLGSFFWRVAENKPDAAYSQAQEVVVVGSVEGTKQLQSTIVSTDIMQAHGALKVNLAVGTTPARLTILDPAGRVQFSQVWEHSGTYQISLGHAAVLRRIGIAVLECADGKRLVRRLMPF